MSVEDYILQKLKTGALHMTLIDPASQDPSEAGKIAKDACALGTDAIMIGGSTGVTQDNLDKTALEIKNNSNIPSIYFPSGASAMSANCDAIYFMSMLNSRSLDWVIREQVAGAPAVKKLGLEPLSMGYIIVEPGMKVGEVGQADAIPRNNPKLAASYAMAGELLGMRSIYLEAGSGAPAHVPSDMCGAPAHVPSDMISYVKKSISVPLIVGGGIRDADAAREVKDAGADVIVTGTIVEENGYLSRLESIINTIKE